MPAQLSLTQYRLLEEYAEWVLQTYTAASGEAVQAPVPLEAIVERVLGLRMEHRNFETMGGKAFGALRLDDGVIVLDTTVSAARNRFTLAHEIAHWVLRRAEQSVDSDDERGRAAIAILLGRGDDRKRAKLLERVANVMGSQLLMPKFLLYQAVARFAVIDAAAVEALGATFQVSLTTMLRRLLDLEAFKDSVGRPLNIPSLDALARRLKAHRRQLDEDRDQRSVAQGDEPEVIRTIRLLFRELGFPVAQDELRRSLRKLGRPLLIEFAGAPNAGKDTQINIAANWLRDSCGLKVKVTPDQFHACLLDTTNPHEPDNDPIFDRYLRAILNTVGDVMDSLDQPAKFDVVLINKGIFDTLGFLHYHRLQGRLNYQRERYLARFLLDPSWRTKVDLVILLTVSLEESLQREDNQVRHAAARVSRRFDPLAPPKPPKRVTSSNGLQQLEDSYDYVLEQYGALFRHIVWLPADEHGVEMSPLPLGVEDIAMQVAQEVDRKWEELAAGEPRERQADLPPWPSRAHTQAKDSAIYASAEQLTLLQYDNTVVG